MAELHSAIQRADTIHHFAKGLGVAAVQLGIRRAAAVVRTPAGEYITLLNPQIINESAETDNQYEGCWSFFDVRGRVPRPLSIEVEHEEIDRTRRITVFDHAEARLVAHEVGIICMECSTQQPPAVGHRIGHSVAVCRRRDSVELRR